MKEKVEVWSPDLITHNFYAIYDSVYAKNPRNNSCLLFDDFRRQFEDITLENYLNVSKL